MSMNGPERGGTEAPMVRLGVIETLGVLLLFVVVWQAWVSLLQVPAIVAPTPLDAVRGIAANWQTMLRATAFTLGAALLGLILGTALGASLAMLSWLNVFIAGFLLPVALVAQTVPVVVLVPVIARLVGYDVRSAITIAVIISFFPTFVFLRGGLSRTPAGSADLFTVYGASRWQRLLRLAIPSLLAVLKITGPGCIFAALVAELLMGTPGLGFVISSSVLLLKLDVGWGAAAIALLISVFIFTLAVGMERRWRGLWT